MPLEHFAIEPFDDWDKSITVHGPGDLFFEVDYDDVDHEQVVRDLRRAVGYLNHMWGLNA